MKGTLNGFGTEYKINANEDKITIKNLPSSSSNLIKNKTIKSPISLKGKKLVSLLARNPHDPKTWDSEYLEHILYRLVYSLISPYPIKKRVIASKLGITVAQINSLTNTPQYIRIKKELRKELRSKWAANIDQVVIKKALMGSKYHAELFYKLEQELIEKHEVTRKVAIEDNAESRKNKINEYIDQLGIGR